MNMNLRDFISGHQKEKREKAREIIAEALGVSVSTVKSWESGKRNPKPKSMIGIEYITAGKVKVSDDGNPGGDIAESVETEAIEEMAEEEDEVLVVVNGEPITVNEYNDKMKRMSNYERARYRGEEGHRKFLQALIVQKIIVQKAIEMGLDKDEEVQNTIAILTGDVTTRALVDALVKREILDKVVVTDEEAMAYYNENKASFAIKEKVKIHQIMVKTEEEAQKIREELDNGADFAELAKEKSIDQHTATKGGDLGYVDIDRLPAELREVLSGLEIGAISNIAKTAMGYHIIKLEERQEATTQEFYEVSDSIKEKLLSGKQQEEHKEWLKQLEEDAKIEMKTGFGMEETEAP